MIQEKLKPKELIDIVSQMDEHLVDMRGMDDEELRNYCNSLLGFITGYFNNSKIDTLELRVTAIVVVDTLYVKIMELEKYDWDAEFYIKIVLNRLFWELHKKNVTLFCIIDNSIRDDRFKLLLNIFKEMQFEVVYPYAVDIEGIESAEHCVRYPTKEYGEIEKQILSGMNQKKHIIYVEKDDSVNYLTNILHLAEEFQNQYICVFRNQTIDKPAEHLLGSFGDILEGN